MGWRSIVINQPAYLSLSKQQLCIKQDDQLANVPLEDISALILDCPQLTLTQPLLCQLAEQGIAVLTVGKQHLPNGIFLPYLNYHRGLKRLKAQLALTRPRIKQWHQQVIRQKVFNQAATLRRQHKPKPVALLLRLAEKIKSGDPDNIEAQAARIYFQYVFNSKLKRSESCFYNAAINYGYAVLRAAIARQISGSGLHPSIGLFHQNEQNPFNLADDLIEPYRPLLDDWVIKNYPKETDRELEPIDKGKLVSFLHQDIGNNQNQDVGTVLANIEIMVQGFAVACENQSATALWLASHASLSSDDE